MSYVSLVLAMLVLAGGCTAEPIRGPDPIPPGTLEPTVPEALLEMTTTSNPGPSMSSTTVRAAITTIQPSTTEILVIDDAIVERMASSWRPGCPVPLEDLRLLRLRYHDFTGGTSMGELVVADDVADDIMGVFEELYSVGFPIERMELVDAYAGDDTASMQANNTSAFNCRRVEGTDRWSEHAYGIAIDINPLLNPWMRRSSVSPAEGAAYADRSLDVPGMIHDGDAVVQAFARIGWVWGGTWRTTKDYQHFSRSGR
ncbi:MAG: M15 family metallopeptidase [Actinobacteria bacterium]|nr:M15 family metallopeptidase [Actinomycetota bacterium]